MLTNSWPIHLCTRSWKKDQSSVELAYFEFGRSMWTKLHKACTPTSEHSPCVLGCGYAFRHTHMGVRVCVCVGGVWQVGWVCLCSSMCMQTPTCTCTQAMYENVYDVPTELTSMYKHHYVSAGRRARRYATMTRKYNHALNGIYPPALEEDTASVPARFRSPRCAEHLSPCTAEMLWRAQQDPGCVCQWSSLVGRQIYPAHPAWRLLLRASGAKSSLFHRDTCRNPEQTKDMAFSYTKTKPNSKCLHKHRECLQ